MRSIFLDKHEFPIKQIEIIKTLLRGPVLQKELAEAIGISGAGLLYHLNLMEEENLIKKETKIKVGNAKIKEISINPNSIQRARNIAGIEQGGFSLITGFGKDSSLGKPYRLPSIAKALLEEQGYSIERIVAFTTPESNLQGAEQLEHFDRILEHGYKEYRDSDSGLITNLESIIREEQEIMDVILDLTPLTKLLTIQLLELSYKYKIPSFYTGMNHIGNNHLIWIYNPG